MNWKSPNTLFTVGLVFGLFFLFFLLWSLSFRGWGYMGYYGYHRGPSFFYWGGPHVYHGTSHRSGSVGGPNHRGGGFRGGK